MGKAMKGKYLNMNKLQKGTAVHNRWQLKTKESISENNYCNNINRSPILINKSNIGLGNIPKHQTT